jgi:hypothetical protein
MDISKEAFDLIVTEEDGSPAYYMKHYRHPEWPGGASGVTIGVGYDCGYATHQELISDWAGHIPSSMIGALTHVIGIHGAAAHALAIELRDSVDIPWDAALAVFSERDVPKWVDKCRKALPNFDKLHPHSRGAIASLAFNRGASFTKEGDRYREMRAIRDHMIACEFAKIPAEYMSMRRLWPEGGDLWKRRGHEAALFEKGLSALPVIASPPIAPGAPAHEPESVKPAAEPVKEPAPKPAEPPPAPAPASQPAEPAHANPLETLLTEIEHIIGVK